MTEEDQPSGEEAETDTSGSDEPPADDAQSSADDSSADAGDASGTDTDVPDIPDDVMGQITALAEQVGGDAPSDAGAQPFCLDFCFYVNGRPWHSFKLCDWRGPDGVNEQAAMICSLIRKLGATCQPVPGAPCP
jgi:hypothetical protein